MPALRFGEQRLDPDLPLAHGLGVGFCGVVAADAIEVWLVGAAPDPPSPARGRTSRLERARVARSRRGLVDPRWLGSRMLERAELGSSRTPIHVVLRIEGKGALPEERRPVV